MSGEKRKGGIGSPQRQKWMNFYVDECKIIEAGRNTIEWKKTKEMTTVNWEYASKKEICIRKT